MFSTAELWCTTNNIFILFDGVHFTKNVRNNWITETFKKHAFHAYGEKNAAK